MAHSEFMPAHAGQRPDVTAPHGQSDEHHLFALFISFVTHLGPCLMGRRHSLQDAQCEHKSVHMRLCMHRRAGGGIRHAQVCILLRAYQSVCCASKVHNIHNIHNGKCWFEVLSVKCELCNTSNRAHVRLATTYIAELGVLGEAHVELRRLLNAGQDMVHHDAS